MKIGRRWLIRTVDFRAWLNEQGKRPDSAEPVALAGGRVHPGEPSVMRDPVQDRGPVEAGARRASLQARIIG